MKRTIACLVALLMLATALPAIGLAEGDGPVTVVICNTDANITDRSQPAIDALNARLAEKYGLVIEFKTIPDDAYQIRLNGMDADLIGAPNYKGYFDNARAGYFAEITEEMIAEYMPMWYADNKDYLAAAVVDGKIYAIPGCRPGLNSPYLMLRRDWFPEGMDECVTLADLDAYFANVKEIRPDIMPFPLASWDCGWVIGALAFGNTFLMAPGAPNCTSTIVLDKRDDPDYKFLRNWEQPQILEYFKLMKDFADKGYWTTDVLNNPTALWQSFTEGNAACFYALGVDSVNWVYELLVKTQKDEYPDVGMAVFDFGLEFGVPADTTSPMGSGVAIPVGNAANMEYALRLIEITYTDEEISNLWRYGVEGVNYSLDGRKVTIIDAEQDIPSGYYPVYENVDFNFEPENGEWPGYKAFRETIRERALINPFADFAINQEPISDIAGNLGNIHNEYGMLIYLGFVDDVEDAIADLNRRYEAAGIDKYEEEIFNQLQAFIADRGIEATITK